MEGHPIHELISFLKCNVVLYLFLSILCCKVPQTEHPSFKLQQFFSIYHNASSKLLTIRALLAPPVATHPAALFTELVVGSGVLAGPAAVALAWMKFPATGACSPATDTN